jgi:hypothetical protein
MTILTEIAARPAGRLMSRIMVAEGATGVVAFPICTFSRRAAAVNLLTRGLLVVVFSLGLFGVSGCSTDNETEAQKLSKGMGDPGKGTTTPKTPEEQPQSNDPVTRFKNRADPKKAMGPNYPIK